MKKYILFLLTFLFILTGCNNQDKTSNKTDFLKNQNETKTLKIGTLSITDGGVLLVAQKDKIFEKYNADVEIIEFASASDQSKAIEGGQIDGIMTDMIIQSLINKGKDRKLKTVLVALGDEVSQGKFIIAASKNTTHNSIDTFEGSKVAISESTMMEFLLDSYCEELGIDINKIEKIHIPSIPLRLETLLAGKDIDSAILPEPLGDFSILKGAKVVIDDTKLNTNLSQSVIVIDEKYINSNRENVQNFIKAYSETAKNINQNPDKYRDYILEIARVPQDMKETYSLPKYSENSVPEKSLFEKVQKWLVKKNLIDEENEYDVMVDSSFLDEK